ncbi:MAG: glycosyltransferase family 2 protein [Burkholderiales bacterium]|nr:glycosyltransferase family 2 protein [Phycisphaerae bacterium]
MTTTVIVVTLNRPDCVRQCLTCLLTQNPLPEEIIVVDASRGDETRVVVNDFPSVLYLRNENGFGRMTASRNIGLKRATGEIIAFVDDDSYARPGWLKNLLSTYQNPCIGAVGGRACNGVAGEELAGVDAVGRLHPNGTLTGNFAADTGQTIDVDHVMGCNMSYRRSVIAELGGFREDYPGISGVREDSDMCVRVKSLGHRVVFNPAAVVDHVGAPQAVGRRFDWRYEFYIQRNHLTLLVRNFGPLSSRLWRYLLHSAIETNVVMARKIGGALIRTAAISAGTAVGIFSGLRLLATTGRTPQRHDQDALAIRQGLSSSATPARSSGPCTCGDCSTVAVGAASREAAI